MPDVPELVDHLFRREAGKMVSHLTRVFGLGRLELAEDVVQDALCRALQTWSIHGVPEAPSAWLMRTARNRALDLVRRDRQFQDLAPDLLDRWKPREEGLEAGPELEREIPDDQLRMMFACCHPDLSPDAQVALVLKVLCGFSVAEIARALLASEDAIEKRLGRARKTLRESGDFLDVAGASAVPGRLEAVQQAIYLLFNEGYHASQSEQAVREDLCHEAMRLAVLLGECPQAARPRTFALLALFCFNAARLQGRVDADGCLIELENQDRAQWDQSLIGKGFEYLALSASGDDLSAFHLEAAIAALHSGAATYEATEWKRIKGLYDQLYALKPTPIVALNRAIAVGLAHGPEDGLRELESAPDLHKLKNYPFLPAARGTFLRRVGREREARSAFVEARNLARNASEIQFLERRIGELGGR